MDHIRKAQAFLGKYRYAFLVLLVGVALMLLPSGTKDQPQEAKGEELNLQSQDIKEELTQILSLIQGVGKVQVMLTVEEGEKTLYQSDEGASGNDTVIITDGSRVESGLVQQVIPMKYRGAVIVCQGADSPAVRLSVIEAVAKVTGLKTDRITVLKMK